MEQIHGGNTFEYELLYGKKPLDFSANINPFKTPDKIKKAIADCIDSVYAYPDINCTKLREKISEYEKTKPEYITVGNGAADLIYAFCYAKKIKKALLLSPTFSEYEKALLAVGAAITKIRLSDKNEFNLEHSIINQISSDTDVLFLCQPNNPTGQLINSDILGEIFSKCSQCNVFIFIDECFLDFVNNGEKYSMKEYLYSKNVFILKSFTKMYAMAGVRLGYGICEDINLNEKINSSRQAWSVSSVAQQAGLAALDERDFVKNSLNYINIEKKRLLDRLTQLNIKIVGSSANYIFFFSEEKNLYAKLLNKGILIRQCENYSDIPKGYFRIAVKSHEDNEKLLSALAEIIIGE